MEVKIHFNTGDVESHSIPPYTGRTITRSEDRDGRTAVTRSDLDLVADVVERLHVAEEDGVVLTRRVVVDERTRLYNASDAPMGASDTLVVLPASQMGEVVRVVCDGETVWPGDDGDSDDEDVVEALDRVSRQMDGLARQTP